MAIAKEIYNQEVWQFITANGKIKAEGTHAYVVTEDHQHVGVFRVVGDLHQRHKRQVVVSEALPKVTGHKNASLQRPGHFPCQYHLRTQTNIDLRELFFYVTWVFFIHKGHCICL